MHLFVLIVGFLSITCSYSASVEPVKEVTYLESGNEIVYTPFTKYRGIIQKNFRIYCYAGVNASVANFFETVDLILDIDDYDYQQYLGKSPEEVNENYEKELFSISFFTQKTKRLHLSPFVQQCVGIESAKTYKLHFHRLCIDLWRVIRFGLGLLLFYHAKNLSQNTIFYYAAGIILGICSSFMLLIWLSSKLVPRRPVMYGVLIGGWTIGVYVFQLLWDNIRTILLTYRTYVFWYIIITGFLSFIFCYRLGPPKNKRSKDIIKWVLQLLGIATCYFSSNYEDAAIAACLLILIINYFPRKFIHQAQAMFRRRFPQKRRLLTEDEYHLQGVEETAKALSELRKYASSPECQQWRVMRKLREPYRFAAFVEGASHLLDDEILSFVNHSDEESSVNGTDSSSSNENARRNKNNRRRQANARDDLSEDDSSGSYNSLSRQSEQSARRLIAPRRSMLRATPTGSSRASQRTVGGEDRPAQRRTPQRPPSNMSGRARALDENQQYQNPMPNGTPNHVNYLLRNQVNNMPNGTNGMLESDDSEITD